MVILDAIGHQVEPGDKVAYVTSKGIIKKAVITNIQSEKRLKIVVPDECKEYWTYTNHVIKVSKF